MTEFHRMLDEALQALDSGLALRFHELYEALAPKYGNSRELSFGYTWEEEHPEYKQILSRIFNELHQDDQFKLLNPSEKAQRFHILFEKYAPGASPEADLVFNKTWEEEPPKYQELLTRVFQELY